MDPVRFPLATDASGTESDYHSPRPGRTRNRNLTTASGSDLRARPLGRRATSTVASGLQGQRFMDYVEMGVADSTAGQDGPACSWCQEHVAEDRSGCASGRRWIGPLRTYWLSLSDREEPDPAQVVERVGLVEQHIRAGFCLAVAA